MSLATKITIEHDSKTLIIPKFEDIPVSTKTIIAMTNLDLNLLKLYEKLPITPYTVILKKRGRKKKTAPENVNKDIPNGSIITIELEKKDLRGVRLKKKKKSAAKKGEDYFRNSITIVMIVDGKHINFKISRNGKFQLTGCKSDNHAEDCVKYVWEHIRNDKEICSNEYLTALFIPAMRNIDFSLGFKIDREKLDQYFNTETDYCSLFETSIGYTGVNIKIPFKKSILDLRLKHLQWKNGSWSEPKYIPYFNYILFDSISKKDICSEKLIVEDDIKPFFNQFFDTLHKKEPINPKFKSYLKSKSKREGFIRYLFDIISGKIDIRTSKEKSMEKRLKNPDITFDEYVRYNLISDSELAAIKKKYGKNRHHTFLIFHSGKCIMSSLCEDFAKETYYEFMNIISSNKTDFQERLLTDADDEGDICDVND